AYQSMAMAGWTSAAMLPTLKTIPTLVLMGQQDGVVPACHGQMIAELIDGSVLEVVPGSHMFPFTHAANIAERISDFLDAPMGQQAAA
ncbi:MAG: alpha/beta fold hydrolase, partial [Sphingopyxis sp.]|uniref:alpha/beta fold hydrolase n=1 Tax=Sphingopyxis sp. TaxID=1908224 RepID=UPI003D6D29EE